MHCNVTLCAIEIHDKKIFMTNYSRIYSWFQKGCLSDALPPSPIIKSDVRATGDTLNLRSASCNDIASVKNNSDNPKGFDKNCNNQMMTSTLSISSTSPSTCRPGMILARSSELLSRSIQSNGDCSSLFRSWKSLCAMPLTNIPSVSVETHPFSGLITSQVQCSDCFWKVSVAKTKENQFFSFSYLIPFVRSVNSNNCASFLNRSKYLSIMIFYFFPY